MMKDKGDFDMVRRAAVTLADYARSARLSGELMFSIIVVIGAALCHDDEDGDDDDDSDDAPKCAGTN